MKKLLCVLLFTLATALSVFALDRETINNTVMEFMNDKNSISINITLTDGKERVDLYILKPNVMLVDNEKGIGFDESNEYLNSLAKELSYCIITEISYNKKTGVLSITYKPEH